LPRIAGEGAAARAAELLALLSAHPALADRLALAERIGGRRWRLRFRDGVTVELPAQGVAEALAQLPELTQAAARTGANEIDLRVAGRTLVREVPGSRQVVGQLSDAHATGGM
jgi:cell division protein FtsQ